MKKVGMIIGLFIIVSFILTACNSSEKTNIKGDKTEEMAHQDSQEIEEEGNSKDVLLPLQIIGGKKTLEYDDITVTFNGVYKVNQEDVKDHIQNNIYDFGSVYNSEYLILDYDITNASTDQIIAPDFYFVNEVGAEWGNYAQVASPIQNAKLDGEDDYEKLGEELSLTVDNRTIHIEEGETKNIRILYAAVKEKKTIELGGYDTDEPLFVTVSDDSFSFEIEKK